MYAVCLESLNLKPGLTCLDVGSGCGWMTTLCGYLVGENGRSHGIDVNQNAIEQSTLSVQTLNDKGINIKNITFEKRNVFVQDPLLKKWDRIHCGASCPHKLKHNYMNFLILEESLWHLLIIHW